MIQILRLLFFTCLSFTSALSQSFYFKTGKSFTNYVFETSTTGLQSSVVKLQTDSGSFYELGAALPFGDSRFSYEFGISLNELNSIVEAPSKVVKYKTEFGGFDNAISFSVIKTKRFLWDAKLGFELLTMVFGKQEIGGVLYDLKQFNEFNGLFFRQSLGTQIKLVTSNQLNFSIGYDYNYDVFNTKNNSNQSLLINSNQIKFGIYYKLEKHNKHNQESPTNPVLASEILNSSIIDSKIESEIKTNKSNKKGTVALTPSPNISLFSSTIEKNQRDSQSNRTIKNSVVGPPSSINSALKATLVETEVNKVRGNELASSAGAKSTSGDTKVTQNPMLVRQPSKGVVIPSNSNIVKSSSSNLGINNLPTTNTANTTNTSTVNVAMKNLSNSNSKIEQLLQNKPVSTASKIVKSTVLSEDKINKSNNSNTNSKTDVLTAILNRLNIIENKLNNLDKKYERK